MPINEASEFHMIADTAPVLIWIAGIDKQCYFFNKGWLDFTGRKMEQEIGNGWMNGVHPDDLERCLDIYNTNSDKRAPFFMEYRLRNADGDYRWISDRGVPRFDSAGEFAGYVGGCMDIHDQKNFSKTLEEKVAQRTKELEDSKVFLTSVLNTTQNLIYVYDFEKGKICFVNGNSTAATGFSPDEIEHSTTDIFSGKIHPDDLEQVKKHRSEIHDNPNDQMATVEYRLKNAKGDWTYQLSRDVVFKRDENGEPVQYIGVSTDISEIRNANDSLVFKNKELENSNFELASFSSIASHDLKEPLRKIQLFSERIIEKDLENISEYSQNSLKRILVSAERMQRLIDDLISYSRTSTEKVRFIKTDLNSLIAEVNEDIREFIEQHKATVDVGPMPTLNVLPSQFRQLFNNLISNAIKYNKSEDAPHVSIVSTKAEKNEVSALGGNPAVDYVKITVSDNGIGFSNEYREKIFEPFKRLHGKDEYSGTGIGLAICKKIMLTHKGFITANSEVGKGAVFSIFVPGKL